MSAAELVKLNAQIRGMKCPGQEFSAVPGEGPADAKIVILGEAPGREEMRQGKPFVGRAGKFLNKQLARSKIDRSKIFISNISKCMPPKGGRPSEEEIKFWLPYIKKQLSAIKPKLVVLLGDVAIKTFLGPEWSVSSCHGKIEERGGLKFLVMPHPSAAMRFTKMRKMFEADMKVLKKFYDELY